MENLPPLYGLEGYEEDLAHVRWPTFYDGWNADRQAFYFQMLGEANTFRCARCGTKGSRHILGVDGTNCKREMNGARRNNIFDQIREKMRAAITRVDARSFLSAADGWGFLEPAFVPSPLRALVVQRPELMVYSMEAKKVMIVNVTVRWERGLAYPNPEPTYRGTVQNLSMNERFSVEIRNIEIGCRGVYCPTLYQLFHEDFQMGDEEIEVTMMNISKGILSCPYEYHRLQN